MRIGLDLDGTVADLHEALAREADALFPGLDPAALPQSVSPAAPDQDVGDASVDPEPKFSASSLTGRQQRELWRSVCDRENFWETLDEIEPGALARLSEIAAARRWEVIFLTSRPETAGDSAQVQSHRWLAAHGYKFPSVFVVHGSRGKIAAALALDILIDDRPENCLDVAIDSTARPVLVWRGDGGTVPASARQLGIGSVQSIAECLDILEALDDSGSKAGLFDRLKRLLGMAPKSETAANAAVRESIR